MTTYGSVCSGIEAASVAWGPLGFTPAWFAEIEPFPSAVLAHHWPHVPNIGDMTVLPTALAWGLHAPDILVGGTPCQAFSVAGARKGLADDRGFLTIKYVELANAIDRQRAAAGKQPCVTVWENVPGVLSSKDNAFGAFLGLLAGEDCELQPPGRKWENAGYVRGPKRAIAWRVLDAQYFGVAQRRRRVFVVSSARKGFDPTEILFEREGVRRDTPPSREAGKAVAALTANGVGTCGADGNQEHAGHLIPTIAGTLQANGKAAGSATQQDAESGMLVIHGTQDPDTNVELAHTLGRNQEQENAVAYTTKLHNTTSNGAGKFYEEYTVSLDRSSPPPALVSTMAIRRLTPVECERLQGFPDGHTDVPYRGKPAADGPRYKAIGNSMAVPVMHWVGKRIQKQLESI